MLNLEDWIMIKQIREKGGYLEDIARELGVSSTPSIERCCVKERQEGANGAYAQCNRSMSEVQRARAIAYSAM